MKNLRLALVAGLLLGGLASGCRTTPGDPSSHWNIDSVDDRIVKHFTGYRGGVDGTYLEYQLAKKNHVGKTLRRHFLNDNEDNPFQGQNPGATSPRRPYGPLPNPVQWFHMESIFLGGAVLAWGGSFVLLPLDSLFALTSPGGAGEFGATWTGDWSPVTENPPRPSTFRVRRR